MTMDSSVTIIAKDSESLDIPMKSLNKVKALSDGYELTTIFIAEVIGTGTLLFMGCMGGLNYGIAQDTIIPSLVFGLTVAIIVQNFGVISGAHLNPAVTLAALISRVISLKKAIVYFIAEIIGATLGFSLLRAIVPLSVFDLSSQGNSAGFCATSLRSDMSEIQGAFTEFIATTILIVLCCACWDPRNSKNTDSTSLKFGFAITGLSLAFGPLTGCSMNPARTFGPALINANFSSHWIYWMGPMAAGLITPIVYNSFFLRLRKD